MDLIYFYSSYFLIFFLVNIYFLNYLKKKNIYDLPSEFKSHKVKTPKGSGVGVTLFIIFSLITYNIFFDIEIENFNIPRFYVLIIGIVILFIISIYDDYLGINPFIRLFIQLTICFLSLSSLPINLWGYMNSYITFSKLNWLIIIYFWLFIVNLTNFFDGVDFLITIKIFFVSFAYLIIGINENDNLIFNISLILVLSSILLGYFNLYPAKFFFGDSGSIPIGFLLGWIFIYLFQKGFLIELLIINMVHFFDIIITEIKKLSKFQNIFIRHRDFIFQKIYDRSYNKKKFYYKYLFIYLILFILFLISYSSEFKIKLVCLGISIILIVIFSNASKK